MADVRSGTILPVLSDFRSSDGTPLYVNRTTGRGYVLNSVDGIVPIVGDSGPGLTLNVIDYGADPTGVADSTAAFNAAFAVLNASAIANYHLLVPPGEYVVSSTTTPITTSGWTLTAYGARILASGSGSYTVFQFGKTPPTAGYSDRLFGVTVKGLTVVKNGTGTLTGIKCVGWGTGCSMQDITSFMGYVNPTGDQGLYFVGTNETAFLNLTLTADFPLVLGNATQTAGDGVDQINFHDLGLYSTTNLNPLITVEAGTQFGTISFTGVQTWAGGNAGFSFIDPTTISNSGNVLFQNIRRENNTGLGVNASGFTIDINVGTTATVQLVSIYTSQFTYGTVINGTAMDGIRIVSNFINLLVCGYHGGGGSGEAFLDITGNNSGNDSLTLLGTHFGAGTITLTNTTTVTGTGIQNNETKIPVVPTGSLPAASVAMEGSIILEDNGAGDRNLVIYAGGQRFRIDGGANV